ncbi:hypothetical protein J132_04718 [Termitomyces sp. J132]|nr:hypothetical protein H2248_012237 [Termitomyces sp. 'cryptogamus']KNZ80742.1 hypothetical protein J132_04718 [Termitomyces sp. J132]
MPDLSSFTFSDNDMLNSSLCPSDSPSAAVYKTSTTVGGVLLLPKTTILTHTDFDLFSHSAIYWEHHEFEIGGVKRKWCTLNYKPKLYSRTREWRWSPVHDSYVVRYKENRWIVVPANSRDNVVAMLTPYKQYSPSNIQPAILSISPSLSTDEKTFLMLVMIYSEKRRQEKRVRT